MNLPDPSSPEAPKYWMNEQGGELVPAMQRYLEGQELSIRQLILIRAYLRQWMDSPVWDMNPALTLEGKRRLHKLREKTREASTKDRIDECIRIAVDMGMDPL